MPAIPSGADELANTLLDNLTEGVEFEIPTVDLDDVIYDLPDETGDLYGDIAKLTIGDLTSGMVGGDGVFDKILSSLSTHLKGEYAANRISGQEYTKAYIGVTGAALQAAVQFLLQRDQAFLSAALVQRQARVADAEVIKARVDIAIAKASLVRATFEAHIAESTYGLTKMKLATEDATYAGLVHDNTAKEFTNTDLLPRQSALLQGQIDGIELDNTGKEYTQINILPKQKDLLQEQIEVQRAQTLDTRTDTATVTGLLGKQKALYAQQIISYQRDAETKAVKMWADAWITQKTLDEGLLAPTEFQNTSFNALLTKLKTNLDLV